MAEGDYLIILIFSILTSCVTLGPFLDGALLDLPRVSDFAPPSWWYNTQMHNKRPIDAMIFMILDPRLNLLYNS